MSARTAGVHRGLLGRIAAAAIALAIAVGAWAAWAGRRDLDRHIVERARLAVELLRGGVERRLASGEGSLEVAARAEVESLAATLPAASAGRFVVVHLLDLDGRDVMRATTPAGEDLPEPPRGAEAREPAGAIEITARREEAGRCLVGVAASFVGTGGRPVGSLRGWFELADEPLAGARARGRLAAGVAAGVVLLTALALYPIVARLLEGQARLAVGLLNANLETLVTLGSAIAKRDSGTDGHNFRVVVYAVRLAEALGLGADLVRRLIKGAFVHDVGKIGVRDEVLLKPGRLDPSELIEMRRHVEHGLDIVARSSWLADAAEVVGGHHERYSGTGYPNGSRGEDIPLAARLFAIADVFDAVTSDRPYHEPQSLDEARALLEAGRGTHFDPALLDAFLVIAPALHARLANRSEEPRREVREIVDRYFRDDPTALSG